MGSTPTLAVIGEVMAEFSPAPDLGGQSYNLGFAGDTFNTAVGAARLGIAAAYVTRLGDDPFSDRIVALMEREGVATGLVERVAGRQPGLYVIANTPEGERTFRYWRNESPARELWTSEDSAAPLQAALGGYDCIYLSGITTAIMGRDARDRLAGFLDRYRQAGGRVAFDSNYRPRLWSAIEDARQTLGRFLSLADIALLTIEDEQLLWGELEAEEIIEQHRRRGIGEVVIKQGDQPVVAGEKEGAIHRIDVPPVSRIVDTTGAGDAFNAGYLAARLSDSSLVEAVIEGNKMAALAIAARGGIPPRSGF